MQKEAKATIKTNTLLQRAVSHFFNKLGELSQINVKYQIIIV